MKAIPMLPTGDGRYEILAQIGCGGMGIVYKARDQDSGDIVALKILNPGLADQADLVERLKTELRLARKITHKNVCRVYDISRLGQAAAIAMEYLEGESLRALLDRRRRLPLPEALDIIRQVLAGLAEAHAQGVVHRDLKPENVFVSGDGTVKVMDFGLARNTDGGGTTTAGAILGSPAYMSPEQVEGRTADTRSDVYSLGLVIYEVVCGTRAFSGDTSIALAMKQLNEMPPSPRVFAPDLPDHIEAAVLTCLRKDPAQRYQNVAAVADALFETEAAGHGPAGRALLPGARAARRALYATTVLVIVFAGTLWYARGGPADGAPASPRKRETPAPIVLAPAQAPAAVPTGKISIAALAFQSVQNQPEFAGLTLGIADALAGSFARSGRFRIVERTQLDQALKELDLNRTDHIDPATAQRVGKLIGAQYLVVGSFQVVGGQIRIDARLVRVETGEVVQADSVTGAASSALVMPDRLAERLLSQFR